MPRLRNPRSLSPPCAHVALCGRLVACHRCNRGRGLTSASNIVTLEKASYMYMYIHIYIYKSRFPNRFRTIPLTFHGTPSEQVTFPPAFLQISDRSLPFSRRCNDTFNCSSLNRGCHEQSEHQKWIELIAGPVAGTSSTWLDLQVSSPTSYFASRKSIWNWQNYYFFFFFLSFPSLLGYDTKSCVARPVE